MHAIQSVAPVMSAILAYANVSSATKTAQMFQRVNNSVDQMEKITTICVRKRRQNVNRLKWSLKYTMDRVSWEEHPAKRRMKEKVTCIATCMAIHALASAQISKPFEFCSYITQLCIIVQAFTYMCMLETGIQLIYMPLFIRRQVLYLGILLHVY